MIKFHRTFHGVFVKNGRKSVQNYNREIFLLFQSFFLWLTKVSNKNQREKFRTIFLNLICNTTWFNLACVPSDFMSNVRGTQFYFIQMRMEERGGVTLPRLLKNNWIFQKEFYYDEDLYCVFIIKNLIPYGYS